jgi:hypothetical protein
MSDYKESTAPGTSWTRACRVSIENPHNGAPSLMFVEEEVTVIGDKTIIQPVSNLTAQMDPDNPTHVALYNSINDLYVVMRTARDEAAATPLQENTP